MAEILSFEFVALKLQKLSKLGLRSQKEVYIYILHAVDQ